MPVLRGSLLTPFRKGLLPDPNRVQGQKVPDQGNQHRKPVHQTAGTAKRARQPLLLREVIIPGIILKNLKAAAVQKEDNLI
jgi:hypothetical protein